MKQFTNSVLAILACFPLVVLSNLSLAQPDWTLPRTEYGHPDLQGVWYFGTNTPFTRPTELGEQKTYSEEEAKAVEAELLQTNLEQDQPLAADRPAPELGAYIGFEADFNFAIKRHSLTRVNGEYRTSLVIDPPNGQIPVKEGFEDFHDKRKALGIETYDGPEAQDAGERCLTGGLAVPSMYPMPWNANLQIVQNENYVMIMTEMNHDARVIKLSGNRGNTDFAYWMGDSIGFWEDDTLVIHTINFRPEQSNFLLSMSEEFELTERLTPVSDDEIIYSFTVVDPLAYSQPFTVERTITRRAADTHIYEVACHEGNYSMTGVLAGARREEMETND